MKFSMHWRLVRDRVCVPFYGPYLQISFHSSRAVYTCVFTVSKSNMFHVRVYCLRGIVAAKILGIDGEIEQSVVTYQLT